jgi:hypothetical protein
MTQNKGKGNLQGRPWKRYLVTVPYVGVTGSVVSNEMKSHDGPGDFFLVGQNANLLFSLLVSR